MKLIRIVTVPISFKHLIRGQARYFANQGLQVLLVSADGPERPDVVAYEGVPHYVVPFTRQITPWHDILCCWQLYKLFRRHRPDIVHTQTPKAGLLGMWVAWWCRVPLRVHTVGGMPLMEASGIKRQLLRFTEKITYRFAHQVLPNSEQLAQWMVAQKLIKPNRLQVLGHGSSNGIDTNHYQPAAIPQSRAAIRQQYQTPPDAFVFVFIGRLVRDKGLVELAEAFDIISTQHPHTWLWLVGPTEQHLDPLPAHTLQYYQNHPRILMPGYQSEVRPWLKAADALVFPSYREGFPNVPMQAGAMGLPLILTDINGCNEIVQHKHNGWLIPPRQVQPLVNAMLQVIAGGAEVESCRQAVRKSIVQRYEQKVIWQEIGRLYGLSQTGTP